ncbi:SDR family NAD(P)-dependent oxidoreductase [Mycolicibacterium holsaticum]|uniref:SDR family NAD(P)-dependent oxidoreductase n=1 Tax=Mycolicibacterium holsaticum TaxID=152142 RepID=UPI001C7CA23D|nr:SDR family oxidoreductase [Mycolicibacterium holsaticum]MDA4110752.1 oxidoreductase [Mycolicibacterium holsaticum DSM 44478 = JCM 12374]QZA14341.1 SDR family oxidoreductase [Mycolicibacterium holsaticum DSM 44478 = JCM 12374]UNC08209.1 SDR family oxidoreductase [Mycolicibacterium holsaticum DSM 44478 = JCM 12374]
MSNRVSFDFTGATALVTGGTSGIGHATATRLRDSGAHVTITGTRARPEDYDVDLSGLRYHQLALTDSSGIDALADAFAELDVLINNAGGNFPGGLDEATAAGFAASVEVNLLAPFRLTERLHGALKASTAAGGASVVMLASMAAIRAVPVVPGYGSAKAGVLALTRNLAVRWAADGIRVNAVVPGVVATRMTAPMDHVPEIKQAQIDHIPLGRFADPAEIASPILYLCSGNASYSTGSALVVDGGYGVF